VKLYKHRDYYKILFVANFAKHKVKKLITQLQKQVQTGKKVID